jgi:sugar O-acyltransferase (sialic acid O-acetyltransferase NeuD family)
MMKRKLLIFPYSGTAIEALDCIGGDFNCIGFVSDDINKIGSTYCGIKVFNRSIIDKEFDALILAVHGSPSSFKKRQEILDELGIPKNRFATVIHPKAIVSPNANIGYNTLVMGGVVITSNARIGNHVCVLPNSVVHHDSLVSDFTLIGANVTIAGNTTIGKNCYIGASSSIINGVSIGDGALVGIGANIIKDVEKNAKMIGNPGRNIGEKHTKA